MAFDNKTDYCGLVAATTPSGGTAALLIRDSDLGGSCEKYQPTGEDGSYLATEVYGEDQAPKNSYGLKTAITATSGLIKLGTITTANTKKYALESISIGTAGGSAVTISAAAREVEADATDATMNHYSVPAFTLSKDQLAQDIFSAFTLSGSGCNLTSCNAEISCTVNPDKVAGVKIGSDVNSGVVTVSGTIIRTSVATSADPVITASEGWVVTKAPQPTEVNGETSYKTYSFELQKVLAKD